MSDEKSNGISTAEDFRRAVRTFVEQELGKGDTQAVPLPSGLKVLLRHPGPFAAESFLRLHRRYWQELKDEAEKNETLPAAQKTYQASIAYQDFLHGMLGRLFVQPGYGTRPGEIGLSDILTTDLGLIFRWLGGEVVLRPDGAVDDLKTFSARSGSADGTGVDRAQEPVPAEPIAGLARDASVSN
jgi:hypothetical protein